MPHSHPGVVLLLIANLSVQSAAPAAATEGQTAVQHQSTRQPADARHEIVQSSLALRWTFKLDRHLGIVHQLVTDDSGHSTWELMPIEELTVSNGDRPRYQIVLSGIAAKGMFLLDTLNGQTWLMTTVTRSRSVGVDYQRNEWLRIGK